MAVLGDSAAQARTPRRAQERHKLAHPVLQAGTALRALIPAKEPGLAMRESTAMQARAVQIKCHALLAGTALRALLPAKEPGRAMREGTAIQAPLQPRGAGLAMRGITAMQARAINIK
jgi:hypothetical protein